MMRKFKFFISLICLITLIGCGKNPIADFSYEPTQPKAGQTVKFTNKSIDAKSFSWNFGDMSIGSDESPSHIYKNAGDYIIDLTASNGLKSDTKTVTIHVSQ